MLIEDLLELLSVDVDQVLCIRSKCLLTVILLKPCFHATHSMVVVCRESWAFHLTEVLDTPNV